MRQLISDNALNYTCSTAFAHALTATGLERLTIRAHCPWQNGKSIERFNRTLATEWAYSRFFTKKPSEPRP